MNSRSRHWPTPSTGRCGCTLTRSNGGSFSGAECDPTFPGAARRGNMPNSTSAPERFIPRRPRPMKIRAVILAGGEGSRLGVLTDKRAKPAVPFAGKYRIIDFTLSNCTNSGIVDVMILTQYRPHSLNEHVGNGRPWDLDRSFSGGVQIYPPYRGRAVTDWYKGTADAIAQNLSFVRRGNPDLILVLSGDHIYKM